MKKTFEFWPVHRDFQIWAPLDNRAESGRSREEDQTPIGGLSSLRQLPNGLFLLRLSRYRPEAQHQQLQSQPLLAACKATKYFPCLGLAGICCASSPSRNALAEIPMSMLLHGLDLLFRHRPSTRRVFHQHARPSREVDNHRGGALTCCIWAKLRANVVQ